MKKYKLHFDAERNVGGMSKTIQENILKLYELQCTYDDLMNDSYLCYGDYDDESNTPTTRNFVPTLEIF